jgi:hypothetical protein
MKNKEQNLMTKPSDNTKSNLMGEELIEFEGFFGDLKYEPR